MLLNTDVHGIPKFSYDNLIDMIYTGHIDKCHSVLCELSDEIIKFNQTAEEKGLPELSLYQPVPVDVPTFDNILSNEWFMPEAYKQLDIYNWLISRCANEIECERVEAELIEFAERNMLPVLNFLVYLVDFMRENKIMWGVGRGSSVSSYVLFKIGIHRVDRLKYQLDYREFLR